MGSIKDELYVLSTDLEIVGSTWYFTETPTVNRDSYHFVFLSSNSETSL